MPFCGKCGAQIDEGEQFCVKCGTPVDAVPEAAPAETPEDTPNAVPVVGNDAIDNKMMAVLAYFGPLVFVPIFVAKKSKFARFHSVQGFNLLLAWVAYAIVFGLLGLIKVTKTSAYWGYEYQATPAIITILGTLVSLAIGVFAIIGIVNAVGGKEKELPIIGKFKFLDSIIKPEV